MEPTFIEGDDVFSVSFVKRQYVIINRKEIYALLKVDLFDLPVCIDNNDDLNKLNKFSSNAAIQTFLLNAEKK